MANTISTLQQQIDASNYLSRLQERTDLALDMPKDSLREQLQSVCDELDSFDVFTDFQQSEEFLIKQKQRFVFCWSLCELQSYFEVGEGGQWQTRFAENSIDFALRYGWCKLAQKQAAIKKQIKQTGLPLPGLFIFGMGKLGGDDLNFSSDVDLVAYFDPQVLPVPDMLGKSYICHQVLQGLTQLLNQSGSADFIWRVDWRLRPNASATTLAMSSVAAFDYYYYRASPWHRLALMKARVVAGDKSTGNQFINTLMPFIWRQNLDYRALDELAEMKQRINLEHPALRAERQWREPITDEVAGFNIKLGSGGIREIEFIANALQLIWGGKKYPLRTPNTLIALGELAKHRHLEQDLSEQLQQSYIIFRRIENAIQMLANQQTHIVPSQEQQQQQLLTLLSISSWAEFVEQLNQHRRVVSAYFETLFAEQVESNEGNVLQWPEQLSDAAREIVDEWENGFLIYGVSNQLKHRLAPLSNALASYLLGLEKSDIHSVDASATVLRLHEFFRALPQGEQYFRLLAESPKLLDSIVPPLLYSPPMSNLLKQSPHIIDCYMEAPWRYPEDGFDVDYVTQAERYDIRLERIRRFVNEHLYQLYLRFIQGDIAVDDFQFALSDLAEVTLQCCLKIVADNMQLDESPISIIGMGKIGLRRMSPTSDLDLIFIFDPDKTELDLASRFVSRLQTAITTPMREGIVYELDTRLRPSGRSGAPTVSVASFATHQLERAHTWEHIALAPSRVIVADKEVQTKIDKVKQQVLSRQRNHSQFIKDAIKMWQRIKQHRVQTHGSDIMFSKLRQGGLMQSEYLAACYILQKPQTLKSNDYEAMLASSSKLDKLSEIIQFWRIQQLWERLLGLTEKPLNSIPLQYQELFLQHSEVASVAQLIEKKTDYANLVQAAMKELFKSVQESDFDNEAWQETSVIWEE